MGYSQAFIDDHRDFNLHHDWWDAVYSNFNNICDILGIELDKDEPCFKGFHSQGDGASWTGMHRSIGKKMEPTYDIAPAKIREYAPKDEELHRIADELCLLSRVYYTPIVSVKRLGNYYHSHTMYVSEIYLLVDGEWHTDVDESGISEEVWEHIENQTTQLFRDLADWLYASLDREYEYLVSDEAVIESLEANEIEEDA
jgi:hypothetical protein